jgi:hypothetical protein
MSLAQKLYASAFNGPGSASSPTIRLSSDSHLPQPTISTANVVAEAYNLNTGTTAQTANSFYKTGIQNLQQQQPQQRPSGGRPPSVHAGSHHRVSSVISIQSRPTQQRPQNTQNTLARPPSSQRIEQSNTSTSPSPAAAAARPNSIVRPNPTGTVPNYNIVARPPSQAERRQRLYCLTVPQSHSLRIRRYRAG